MDDSNLDGLNSQIQSKSILIFGDGDFSYSYDLARSLKRSENAERIHVHLVATGLDTYDELIAKYKDAPFLLKQLKKCSDSKLSIEVQHGINALVEDSPSRALRPTSADMVVFNHPHIAQENAILHAQFLSHFFYSARNYWLANKDGTDGILYLTLVVGQWERWGGPSAAARHGLILVHRSPCVDIPLDATDVRYYQLRRHQTGKSFAARRTASEVFCLRKCRGKGTEAGALSTTKGYEVGTSGGSIIPAYPFGNVPTLQKAGKGVRMHEATHLDLPFACELCERRFAEARSLKNHKRSKHRPGSIEKNPKRSKVHCGQCSRVFDSIQARDDHVQARHEALHTNVRPPRPQEARLTNTTTCPICGYAVPSLTGHFEALRAKTSLETTNLLTCVFCQKNLCDERALWQHENFCKARNQLTKQSTIH